MSENDAARFEAAKCLRMAKRAENHEEKQSLLALAESWLTTVQLQPTEKQNFQLTEEEKTKALEWAAR